MVQWCVCCHPRYLGGSRTRSRFHPSAVALNRDRSRFHPSAVAYPPGRGRESPFGRVGLFGDRHKRASPKPRQVRGSAHLPAYEKERRCLLLPVGGVGGNGFAANYQRWTCVGTYVPTRVGVAWSERCAVAHPVALVCDLGFRGVSRPNSRCQFRRALNPGTGVPLLGTYVPSGLRGRQPSASARCGTGQRRLSGGWVSDAEVESGLGRAFESSTRRFVGDPARRWGWWTG